MGLRDLFRKAEQGDNNIYQDGFDKMVLNDIIEQSPKLKEQIKRGSKIINTFPSFVEDVFSSMYKIEPSLTREIPQGTELNRRELENMMQSQQYSELRDYSVMDEYSSSLACTTVIREVINRIEQDEDLKKLAQQQNENGEGQDDPNKTDEENQQAREQRQQQMQQALDQNASKLRRAIGAGVQKAQQEAKDNDDVATALGWGDEEGEFKQLSIQDKEKLFEQAKRMKKMTDIVGKMRNIARKTRQLKIQSTQNELCGVTIGDTITNVLPQELLALSHPSLKLDFYRRLAERQLLQFELKRKEEQGKGNIVVLLDDSGSMDMGSRREYARGAIFGLIEIAKNDKRNIAVNIFSSRREEWKREYKLGKMSLQESIDLLNAGWGNGTSFDSPVLWALDMVRENTYKDADIIIITDGECDLESKTLKQVLDLKKELNTSIHAITLDYYPEHMKRWCDSIWRNLDSDTLEDLMNKI